MSLIADIDAFLETHKISERRFGELATNDKNLVPQLRGIGMPRPRRLWPDTENKIRRFMVTYSPDSDEPEKQAVAS